MAEVNPSPANLEQRRPLSPHLSIYRPMLTMTMSITHRITGAALYAGTILLVWWLIALSTDAKAFATVSWFMGSIFGRIILFGFTWALFHHFMGGIRHAIWESGHGMGPERREQLAWISLIGGIALTVIVWVLAYAVR